MKDAIHCLQAVHYHSSVPSQHECEEACDIVAPILGSRFEALAAKTYSVQRMDTWQEDLVMSQGDNPTE